MEHLNLNILELIHSSYWIILVLIKKAEFEPETELKEKLLIKKKKNESKWNWWRQYPWDKQYLNQGLITIEKKALFEVIGLSSKTPRFEDRLNLLISIKWIVMPHPENLNHAKQAYYTTEAGKEVLRLKQDGEENENI